MELLAPFQNIKSLILGDNAIGDKGVAVIVSELTALNKLSLNSNKFKGTALKGIAQL